MGIEPGGLFPILREGLFQPVMIDLLRIGSPGEALSGDLGRVPPRQQRHLGLLPVRKNLRQEVGEEIAVQHDGKGLAAGLGIDLKNPAGGQGAQFGQ